MSDTKHLMKRAAAVDAQSEHASLASSGPNLLLAAGLFHIAAQLSRLADAAEAVPGKKG